METLNYIRDLSYSHDLQKQFSSGTVPSLLPSPSNRCFHSKLNIKMHPQKLLLEIVGQGFNKRRHLVLFFHIPRTFLHRRIATVFYFLECVKYCSDDHQSQSLYLVSKYGYIKILVSSWRVRKTNVKSRSHAL